MVTKPAKNRVRIAIAGVGNCAASLLEGLDHYRRHPEDESECLTCHTGDGGSLYRLSRCILQAHEDKLYQGSLIASMSIPGPTFRLDSERLAEAVPLLVSAATEVSHRLGWGQRT